MVEEVSEGGVEGKEKKKKKMVEKVSEGGLRGKKKMVEEVNEGED